MMDGYEWLANVMKALGHPARLRILEVLLREGEACVCHLESALDRPQAYISQQLARLREAGLVIDRRDGMNVFYSPADESIAGLLDEVRGVGKVLAKVGETDIRFSEFPIMDSETCPCPKCRKRIMQSKTVKEYSEE